MLFWKFWIFDKIEVGLALDDVTFEMLLKHLKSEDESLDLMKLKSALVENIVVELCSLAPSPFLDYRCYFVEELDDRGPIVESCEVMVK